METKLREIMQDESGRYIITCRKHHFGSKYSSTKGQKEYFDLLGGTFDGKVASRSQMIKNVTKLDMSVAIDLLKKGEKVTIFID